MLSCGEISKNTFFTEHLRWSLLKSLEVSWKKGVLKKFAILTGKHFYALFFLLLYRNIAFSISVLSTKKWYFSFLKKVLLIVQNFQWLSHKNIPSLKQTAILEIPGTAFWKNQRSFCWLEKALSSVKTKANPNFTVKVVERSNRSLSFYLMNPFFKHL